MGAPVAGWNGSANARVQALMASPNGDRVFVGGRFTGLSGQSRDTSAPSRSAGRSLVASTGALPRRPEPLLRVRHRRRRGPGVRRGGGPVARCAPTTSPTRPICGTSSVMGTSRQSPCTTARCTEAGTSWLGSRDRAGIVALSPAAGGVLAFDPLVTEGLGVWDILADDASLRLGGGFLRIDGSSARQRYAEFPAVTAPDDSTSPSVPTNLRTTDVSDTIASLRWDAARTPRGWPATGCGATARTGDARGHHLLHRDLDPSTSYTYRVQAVDAAGNWSALSDPFR